MISIYDALENDSYRPKNQKEVLGRFDNYQIYSLVWVDYPQTETYFRRSRIYVSTSYGNGAFSNVFGYTIEKDFEPESQADNFTYSSERKGTGSIAFQRYSILPIPVNFNEIASLLNVRPKNSYEVRSRISRSQSFIYSDDYGNGAPTDVDLFQLYNVNRDGDSFYDYPESRSLKNSFASVGSPAQGTAQTYERKYYLVTEQIAVSNNTPPPLLSMYSAIGGYSGDNRISAKPYPIISISNSGTVQISYYRPNRLESVPNITSLDWMSYTVSIDKNKSIALPLIDVVFGSLVIDGDLDLVNAVKTSLNSIESENEYRWGSYFAENINTTVGEWKTIYDGFNSSIPSLPGTIFGRNYREYNSDPITRVLSANNNAWNNDDNNYEDINLNLNLSIYSNYPILDIREQKAYDWHVKPQLDGSYGDLVMNSPKLEDIWYALNAGKYAVNPDDPTKPRVTTLGHLIEKTAFLLGYRPEPDGNFKKELEEPRVKRVINSKQKLDKTKIGVNNFGSAGMILKRINNRFKGKEIVSDECVIVQDIPQLIGEFQDQINIALGLQESSAIEVNTESGTARYNNQLEVMIELVSIAKANQEMLRAALTSSLVTQGQTSEIIGGLGLPSLTKTLPVKIDGKNKQIPYKGISPHRSISQEIATCTYNVGIVTGHLI
jgi:hypothetical protein